MRSSDSTSTKQLLVCFDFEGSYGMPYDVSHDLQRAGRRILERLAAYEARAVFFVVGRIVEENPEIVSAIAEAGHVIGLHGYEHDDLGAYDRERLAKFDNELSRVEQLVEELTGARPECFRAPYLLGPHFYRREVYALLHHHGYTWVSNREIRYPIELFRPDRIPIGEPWSRPIVSSRLGLAALNAALVVKETFGDGAADRLRWLLGRRQPFERDGLLEVPLYAPLDCDIVALPRPEEDTPPKLLDYARGVIRSAVAVTEPQLSMVTFHDWIIAGGNRLVLLDEALAAARTAGRVVSPFDPAAQGVL